MGLSIFLSFVFLLLYFGYEIRFISSISLILYVSISGRKIGICRALLIFLYILCLVVFSEHVLDLNTISFGFDSAAVTRITGYAVNDSVTARYNSSRVTVALKECNTKYGAVASARGNLSVTIRGRYNIMAGDLVSFDGKISAYGFNAKSFFIRSRPSYNKAREKLLDKLKTRIGDRSDEEILSTMLLLGISPEPEYTLSSLARESGTSFVLALSGMHIGLFSALLGLLLRPVFKRRGARLISLVLLFFYVALIGPKPSLVRALILSLMFFCFPSLKGIENLALTFLLQLILFPSSAVSMSAVFSYLSLAGILGFMPYFSSSLDRLIILPRFLSSIVVSISAVLYTVPFTYMVFGEYQLSAIATSALVSILIYVYMLVAIASLFIPLVLPLRSLIYMLIYRIMKIGSAAAMQQTPLAYIIFLLFILSVLLLSCILSLRRRRCGSLTMTVRRK